MGLISAVRLEQMRKVARWLVTELRNGGGGGGGGGGGWKGEVVVAWV